jgi:hypothetical protein
MRTKIRGDARGQERDHGDEEHVRDPEVPSEQCLHLTLASSPAQSL